MLLIYKIIAFIIAITVHEAAHAWVSDRLGDPTAKLADRISLNPLKHLDLYGTVLVPLFLIFAGSPFVFGWAKPVMFDPYNLRDPRKDAGKISFSGPLANILVALITSLLVRFTADPFSPLNFLTPLFYFVIGTNLTLAIFNLIPIHPLDGGKVIVALLPPKDAAEFGRFMNRWGFVLLLFLIFPIFGSEAPVNRILSPILNFLFKLLLPAII